MTEIRIVTTPDGHIGSITQDGAPWPPVVTPPPPPVVTPPPVPAPPAAAKLAWAPPPLDNPQTILLSNAHPTATNLDPAKDYILKCVEPITVKGGIHIAGGRNLYGLAGEVAFKDWFGTTADSRAKDNRALYLQNWTGTLALEGWRLGGVAGEGWDADTRTPGAILQLCNIHVDKVQGERAPTVAGVGGNHADIGQNWGGPTTYRIDGLTATSNYQGFMLQPTQFDAAMVTALCDFRRMNIHIAAPGRYAFFRTSSGTKQITLADVWVDVEAYPATSGGYPQADPTWNQIHRGIRPEGDFVPAGSVGMGYKSPGYLTA